MANLKNKFNRVAEDKSQLQEFANKVCDSMDDGEGEFSPIPTEEQIEKLIKENSTKLYLHHVYFSTADEILVIDNSKEKITEANIFSRIQRSIKSYVATAEYNDGILLSFANPGTGLYTIVYYDYEEGINTIELTEATFEDTEITPY